MNEFPPSETNTYNVSPEELRQWPGWAQTKYVELRKALEGIRKELAQVQRAHRILYGRNRWVAIHEPEANAKSFSIFVRQGESFVPIWEVGRDDVLLIGRREENGEGK